MIGANRDERRDRAFLAPGRHWPDAPGVVGGRDVLGGGSWLGVNDDGVFATIVNGMDRLGPQSGKASRGELVVRALRERDATGAAQTIGTVDVERYRGFTMLIADRKTAFSVSNDERAIAVERLAPGHHLVTPDGCDVPGSPRFAAHFEAFRAAAVPNPALGDWTGWAELLTRTDEDDPHRATLVAGSDTGTVSSTLVALPVDRAAAPVLLFAAGPPGLTAYAIVREPWVRPARVESA